MYRSGFGTITATLLCFHTPPLSDYGSAVDVGLGSGSSGDRTHVPGISTLRPERNEKEAVVRDVLHMCQGSEGWVYMQATGTA